MPQIKKKQKMSKKKKRRLKIIKWTSLSVLTLVAVVLFLLSDVFKIKAINVINNKKISDEEIIEISNLQINENRFKFLKIKTEEKIKKNPYIDTVNIKRKLNGTIEIEVKERVASYMIMKEDKFAYINNQGYILEISEEKLELPIISGIITENIEPGMRLEEIDLKKLNSVIQISKTAKDKELDKKISEINIQDENDLLIIMACENKIIHFGNSKNIVDKFINIEAMLIDTQEKKGEIFVKNIEKTKVFFREDFREEGV